METKAILKREGLIEKRENLLEVVEENCLQACLELYDKNIRTVASNGNIPYARRLTMYKLERASLFIHIDYDSLDDTNKNIAEKLYKSNLVDISMDDTYGGIRKKVIIMEKNNAMPGKRPMFDVENFKDKSMKVVDCFVKQDVLFGRFTPFEILKNILLIEDIHNEEEAKKFLIEQKLCNDRLIPNIEIILKYVEKIECPIYIMDKLSADYKTIYLGKIYDEETNEFWVNDELLEKHKEYYLNFSNKR